MDSKYRRILYKGGVRSWWGMLWRSGLEGSYSKLSHDCERGIPLFGAICILPDKMRFRTKP